MADKQLVVIGGALGVDNDDDNDFGVDGAVGATADDTLGADGGDDSDGEIADGDLVQDDFPNKLSSGKAISAGKGKPKTIGLKKEVQGAIKKGGKKRVADGPTFKCTLCIRDQPTSQQVPGYQWDRVCKKSYDGLSYQAKMQKKVE